MTILGFIAINFFPESPQYHFNHENYIDAMDTLNTIAKFNKVHYFIDLSKLQEEKMGAS